MRYDKKTLAVTLGASGTGAVVQVGDYREKTVQIGGTFSATVAIEGTINGTDWFVVYSGTAKTIQAIALALDQIRVTVSGWVSGQPTVMFGGFNSRTE